MTWMTPFEADTFGFTTLAPLTYTIPPLTRIWTVAPFSVFAERSFVTFAAVSRPATTW